MKRHIFLILLFLTITITVKAQRPLQGMVTNEDDEPLIGANILVQGTSQGTVTDLSGKFSLQVPDNATTLSISHIGYVPKEISIGTENFFQVVLQEGLFLSEAVVTALGISRNTKAVGYAVQQLQGEDMARVRDVNLLNNLSGQVSGMQIIGNSGNLGGSVRILLRGIRSLTAENQPLFVVDGIPLDNSSFASEWQQIGAGGYDYGSPLQDLNPDNIESINVLKGQAATSLYGSRGNNGVILISLKKGSKARQGIGVTVNTSITFDEVLVWPELQNEYGGSVDLLPLGRADGQGYYQLPIVFLGPNGDTTASYSSFDLAPIYEVDQNWGPHFNTSTEEHFTHLGQLAHSSGSSRYLFPNGYGSGEDFLMFRDWNTYDAWDSRHFLQSRRWEASPDNARKFYETGKTVHTSVGIEGGNDQASFRLSFANLNQAGIFPNSHLTRNNVGLSGNYQPDSQLSIQASGNLSINDVKGRSGTGYSGNSMGASNAAQLLNNWFQRHLRMDDLREYKNPDGSMRTWNRISPVDPNPRFWNNIFWDQYENFQTDIRHHFFGQMKVSYQFNDWLSMTGRLMTDYLNERRQERYAVGSIGIPYYRENLYEIKETNMDLILRASQYLSSQFSFDAFIGGNRMRKLRDINIQSTQEGLSVPELYSLQNSKGPVLVNDFSSEKQINSIFGGLTLGYNELLYLDLTGRNDWSSTLPENNNDYFYPSASLSFVFSELWKPRILSFGKLRFGWAKAGNDTDPYRLTNTYVPVTNFGNLPNYAVPNTLNNPYLKPEITTSKEIGLDLRFWQNRLKLDLSLYDNQSVNQIIPINTSGATGFTSQFINAGKITNRGVELTLTALPVNKPDLQWEIGFNYARNVNEIVELNADDPNLTALPLADFVVQILAVEGRSYGTFMGMDFLYDADGNRLVDPNTGFYLSTQELVPIGNMLPDWIGGVRNRITYRNFECNLLVDASIGGNIFSFTNVFGKYSGTFKETAENGIRENGIVAPGKLAQLDAEGNPELVDAGDPDRAGDEVYATTGADNNLSINAQDYFAATGLTIQAANIYDASYIKLREVSLGFHLSEKWLDRLPFSDCYIGVVGRNLAILYKDVPNIDPENAYSSGNVQGLDGGQLPSTRSIGFNLRFKF